jgi:HTH-type transcriptional regulator/antitoxin HigA
MSKVTKVQYEFAPAKIEELLPFVNGDTQVTDKNMIELTVVTDIYTEELKAKGEA